MAKRQRTAQEAAYISQRMAAVTQNLRLAVAQRHLMQKDLADVMEVSPSLVSSWMHRRKLHNFSIETLFSLEFKLRTRLV